MDFDFMIIVFSFLTEALTTIYTKKIKKNKNMLHLNYKNKVKKIHPNLWC